MYVYFLCLHLSDKNNLLSLSHGIILPLRKTETTKSDLETLNVKYKSSHKYKSCHKTVEFCATCDWRLKDSVARLLGSNKLTRISASSFTVLSFGTTRKSSPGAHWGTDKVVEKVLKTN